MKTYTMEQIRQFLTVEMTEEVKQGLLDAFRENTSPDDAAELMIAVMPDTIKEAADREGWTHIDRLLWIVKEAYCMGQLSGQLLAQDFIAMQLQEMESQG